MSERQIENQNEDQRQDGGDGGVEDAPWSPSKDDWDALVAQNQKLSKTTEQLGLLVTSLYEDPEDDTPVQGQDGRPDLGRVLSDYFDARIGPIMPAIETTMKEAGTRRMNELLDSHEAALKKEFPDGFDRKLAARAATAFFDENQGDPEAAVEAAARYAAEVRREERAAAAPKPKRSIQGEDLDLPVSGGATPGREKAKTYDEVIERWAAEAEV